MLLWVLIFIYFLVLKSQHTKVSCISLSCTSIDSVVLCVPCVMRMGGRFLVDRECARY